MSWSYAPNTEVSSFHQLVKARMTAPSKILIKNSEDRAFSCVDYWSLAGQMANVLVARGVRRGDRIAVQVEKSIEALAVFLACSRIGGVFLPLNTAYTAAELDHFIGDAGPSLIICSPEREESITVIATKHSCRAVETLDAKGGGTFMDIVSCMPSAFIDNKVTWDDLIAILYTSGTTGRSKGAMLTHGNLASNALALVDTWQITPEDVLIHALPIYHTHGLFTATNTILLAGGTMIFLPKFDANDVIAWIPQATMMMGVPTFYTRLLQHPGLTRHLTAHMRLFISGSAPLLTETHQQFLKRTGHAILERYGMTETNMNASNPYDGARRAGTVGKPLPGVELRITDPATGSVLAQGETGMIEVRGPNVFKGYWRMPEKTAEEIRSDGYFITGDLGRIDADGYISIVGRGKDLVITGGFNVYPKEVESEIDAIEGVVESAVIGIPHPDFGEGVTAIVVLATSGAKLTERDIVRALETRLAKFKMPKRVIAVESLPRNSMGKVQKNVLREAYASIYS